MTGQIMRLAPGTPSHLLNGDRIDRQKPLNFRLNGRVVHFYKGDSVLSALLANGIDILGQHRGYPIGLSQRLAPAAIYRHELGNLSRSMPIDRLPAIDGTDLRLVGTTRRLGRGSKIGTWLGRNGRSLGLTLDDPRTMRPEWLNAPLVEWSEADFIVIGGGVAGMAAAIHAARQGCSVTLIERDHFLGGGAELFGKIENEPSPSARLDVLRTDIARLPNITVLLRAEVGLLRPERVLVHQVNMVAGKPLGRQLSLKGRHIILATGAIERLPIFAGNRLPGVVGTAEAFGRAWHYGVWAGQTNILASASNAPYRLAMMGHDAERTMLRLADSRLQPQSRFIEFSKAYGMRQTSSTVPIAAQLAMHKQGRLAVTLGLAVDQSYSQVEQYFCDQLLVSGGWQADLTLWHGIGGTSIWDAKIQQLTAENGPQKVWLVGAAANWVSTQACVQSGMAAVNQALGQKKLPIEEQLIDPIYETPDGPTPIAPTNTQTGAPAYLGPGRSLIGMMKSTQKNWRGRQKSRAWSLAEQAQALEVSDVAAGVQLGHIPVHEAGIIAQARAVTVADLSHFVRPRPASENATGSATEIPDFLWARWGEDAQIWTLTLAETCQIETGVLVFENSEIADPRCAIGVVTGTHEGAPIALIRADYGAAARGVSLKLIDRHIAARLCGPFALSE